MAVSVTSALVGLAALSSSAQAATSSGKSSASMSKSSSKSSKMPAGMNMSGPTVLPSGPAIFGPQGVSIKAITKPVRMTKNDPFPSRAFTAPSFMLADPSNPSIILATTADLRTRVCYLMRSTNAGASWEILPALPSPGSYPDCTGPTAGVPLQNMAFGRNDALYYAMDGYDQADGGDSRHGNYSVLLSKSSNLGNSWTTTLVDNNRGKTGAAVTNDGPVTGLAVDTSGSADVVYVGFSQNFPNAPKSAPQKNYDLVAVSTNGGASFGPPVNLNSFAHLSMTVGGKSYPIVMSGFGAPYLVVHGGTVLAFAEATSVGKEKIPGSGGVPMVMARSTNQGRTWTLSTISPDYVYPTGDQVGVGWTPLGGSDGTFLVAYAATPNEAAYAAPVIEFQRSTDLGRTWTSPVILDNDNLSQQYSSFFPQMGVAPDGRVDVIWWDNRRSKGYGFDIYYTYSTDGGRTWAPNIRISQQPSDFAKGISFGSDVRQPPGVASTNYYAAMGWTSTNSGNSLTETQDDIGAVAQFAPLPPASSDLLPILAAVFGGLLLAGLLLLGAVFLRRRSGGGTLPPPPPVKVKDPAGTV
jgi:hypothetical protein